MNLDRLSELVVHVTNEPQPGFRDFDPHRADIPVLQIQNLRPAPEPDEVKPVELEGERGKRLREARIEFVEGKSDQEDLRQIPGCSLLPSVGRPGIPQPRESLVDTRIGGRLLKVGRVSER